MKSKLKKIQMPQSDKFSLDELLSSEGEEKSEEGQESESPEMEPSEGPSSPLEQVSDDELMAEMKKRGLMSEMDESGEPSEEQPDFGM